MCAADACACADWGNNRPVSTSGAEEASCRSEAAPAPILLLPLLPMPFMTLVGG